MKERAALALLVFLPGFAAIAQVPADPPDSVPEGAQREIRDLNYPVEALKAQVQEFRVRETDLEVVIELPADVLFDFDKATLRPAAEKALANAAELIRTKAKGAVRISGHTDGKGDKGYNQKLSERRAQAVKDYLVKKAQLTTFAFNVRGYGAENPVAANAKPDGSDDPEGRQRNRRVEIVIRKVG